MAKKAATEIDAQYGLEPVFEPGSDARTVSLTPFATVVCPYCRSEFETTIDVSAGPQTYIEDCAVCCQSLQLSFTLNAHCELARVSARRLDEMDS
jgi:Cysteine-rich CPXCG